jgi:hypothetical protein
MAIDNLKALLRNGVRPINWQSGTQTIVNYLARPLQARQRLINVAGRHQAEMHGKVRRCLQARKSAVGVSGTSGSYPCGEMRS